MSLLTTIRQRRLPWARRTLGLFVVAWLTVALQPCAMAFESTNHGQGHCPLAQSSDGAAQDANAADLAGIAESPCSTSPSQCAYIDGFNYDGRAIDIKVKNAPSDQSPSDQSPIVAAPGSVVALGGGAPALRNVGAAESVPANPLHLNVLYCIYVI